jgi:hypothetical protein
MQVVAAEFSGYHGKNPLLSNPQWVRRFSLCVILAG